MSLRDGLKGLKNKFLSAVVDHGPEDTRIAAFTLLERSKKKDAPPHRNAPLPAVEWASGTKCFLREDGFTVYGADGRTDMKNVKKIGEKRENGVAVIEYAGGNSVTISDQGITVKHADTTHFYSKDRPTAAPTPKP